MLVIHDELSALAERLEVAGVRYALCGALALAIHGHPRATYDIDLLAFDGSEAAIAEAARTLGFALRAGPMQFAGGRVKISRVSKPEPGSEDILSLDILALAADLENQIEVESVGWRGNQISVVTRLSLVFLKRLRGSLQDQVDIAKLT